ncbi:uncharacterized protein YukE [Rhodococcus sp. LBL1]|nr:uncharacterized protein YukE [Rhodococcus sp. LBL1]MDH6686112.1 uncharacterized protein YukE [Rhodococcus sp. LBL2]
MTTTIDLKDPVASDPVPDLVENILGAAQYMSPTYWFNEAAKMVCGTDPMAWIASQFAGDWEAVQRAGVAIESLGQFDSEYAQYIDRGVTGIPDYWRGDAADAASKYFTEYAAAIKNQSHDLAQVGEQFQQIAIGMYEAANAVKGLWQALFDWLIELGITFAAAMVTGPTGIGAVVGMAAAAAEIAAATAVWRRAVEVTGQAWDGAQGTIGLITGYASGLENIPIHELPRASYDHEGV